MNLLPDAVRFLQVVKRAAVDAVRAMKRAGNRDFPAENPCGSETAVRRKTLDPNTKCYRV